ncbi:Lrp/AsnC family transcriptional regulator [Amycolatopsis nalaikhensis]|uniref:Lrp/AsnC family transcriptional regulator n=1 Tax=Amycolatopsis nalaikhensis TaxID=715472 RepID=A0ABY8XH88_9PSEU|nr:Lrp/AsnC family transcriptional regulator [Amycolatopsis sp. 2-2]WIV54979.1 Lrp/AsnC family transcriptional regulator [Amycolatopsis sp. 2-2]
MDVNLDEIDERLVRALQDDGRASYETLASVVGLARSTTKARVQRLLREGALRLVGAIHPAVFGLHQLGHVIIETDGPAGPVADEVAKIDEVSFVTTTAGRFAVTAELRAADMAAFARGLARVQAVPGVRSAQTMTYLRIWKDPYFPPGPLESPGPLADIDLDAANHALLEHLRTDGRASFADLASLTGLSPGATRVRVLRLLEAGVVHVGALVRLTPLSRTYTMGFALTFTGDAEPVARKVAGLAEIDCLATGAGWCDAIGTIRVGSLDEVLATLERLRALPGVRTVEAWTHLRAIKEENDRAVPPA